MQNDVRGIGSRSRAPQTSGPYAICHPFLLTSDALAARVQDAAGAQCGEASGAHCGDTAGLQCGDIPGA